MLPLYDSIEVDGNTTDYITPNELYKLMRQLSRENEITKRDFSKAIETMSEIIIESNRPIRKFWTWKIWKYRISLKIKRFK